MIDKKNIIFNSITNIVNVLFPIIALLYSARILGVENVGIINLALTTAVLFSVFAMLGINIYGVREVAIVKDDAKAITVKISELLTLIFLSVITFTLIFIVLLNNVEFFSTNREFYYLAMINLISSAFNVDWVYQGLGRFQLLALRSVFVKLIALCAIFLLISDPDDAFLYLGIMVSSTACINIYNFISLSREFSPGISLNKILMMFDASSRSYPRATSSSIHIEPINKL